MLWRSAFVVAALVAAAVTPGTSVTSQKCDAERCCCITSAAVTLEGPKLKLEAEVAASCACQAGAFTLTCDIQAGDGDGCTGQVDGSPFSIVRAGSELTITTQCIDYTTFELVPNPRTLSCTTGDCLETPEWGGTYHASEVSWARFGNAEFLPQSGSLTQADEICSASDAVITVPEAVAGDAERSFLLDLVGAEARAALLASGAECAAQSIVCERPARSCPADAVLDGTTYSVPTSCAGATLGAVCAVVCPPGQESSTAPLVCKTDAAGVPQWTGAAPRCSFRCPTMVPDIANQIPTVCPGNHIDGDTCEPSCMPGYTGTGSRTYRCAQNGVWIPVDASAGPLACEVLDCGAGPELENKKTACDGSDFLDRCSLTCAEGYTSTDGSAHDTESYVCNGNAQWALASAAPVQCAPVQCHGQVVSDPIQQARVTVTFEAGRARRRADALTSRGRRQADPAPDSFTRTEACDDYEPDGQDSPDCQEIAPVVKGLGFDGEISPGDKNLFDLVCVVSQQCPKLCVACFSHVSDARTATPPPVPTSAPTPALTPALTAAPTAASTVAATAAPTIATITASSASVGATRSPQVNPSTTTLDPLSHYNKIEGKVGALEFENLAAPVVESARLCATECDLLESQPDSTCAAFAFRELAPTRCTLYKAHVPGKLVPVPDLTSYYIKERTCVASFARDADHHPCAVKQSGAGLRNQSRSTLLLQTTADADECACLCEDLPRCAVFVHYSTGVCQAFSDCTKRASAPSCVDVSVWGKSSPTSSATTVIEISFPGVDLAAMTSAEQKAFEDAIADVTVAESAGALAASDIIRVDLTASSRRRRHRRQTGVTATLVLGESVSSADISAAVASINSAISNSSFTVSYSKGGVSQTAAVTEMASEVQADVTTPMPTPGTTVPADATTPMPTPGTTVPADATTPMPTPGTTVPAPTSPTCEDAPTCGINERFCSLIATMRTKCPVLCGTCPNVTPVSVATTAGPVSTPGMTVTVPAGGVCEDAPTCRTNERFCNLIPAMKVQCPVLCNTCPATTTAGTTVFPASTGAPSSATTGAPCQDGPNCAGAELSFCEAIPGLKAACPVTCEMCSPPTTVTAATRAATDNACQDDSSCGSSPRFCALIPTMKTKCPVLCGTCAPATGAPAESTGAGPSETPSACEDAPTCGSSPRFCTLIPAMKTQCPVLCGTCSLRHRQRRQVNSTVDDPLSQFEETTYACTEIAIARFNVGHDLDQCACECLHNAACKHFNFDTAIFVCQLFGACVATAPAKKDAADVTFRLRSFTSTATTTTATTETTFTDTPELFCNGVRDKDFCVSDRINVQRYCSQATAVGVAARTACPALCGSCEVYQPGSCNGVGEDLACGMEPLYRTSCSETDSEGSLTALALLAREYCKKMCNVCAGPTGTLPPSTTISSSTGTTATTATNKLVKTEGFQPGAVGWVSCSTGLPEDEELCTADAFDDLDAALLEGFCHPNTGYLRSICPLSCQIEDACVYTTATESTATNTSTTASTVTTTTTTTPYEPTVCNGTPENVACGGSVLSPDKCTGHQLSVIVQAQCSVMCNTCKFHSYQSAPGKECFCASTWTCESPFGGAPQIMHGCDPDSVTCADTAGVAGILKRSGRTFCRLDDLEGCEAGTHDLCDSPSTTTETITTATDTTTFTATTASSSTSSATTATQTSATRTTATATTITDTTSSTMTSMFLYDQRALVSCKPGFFREGHTEDTAVEYACGPDGAFVPCERGSSPCVATDPISCAPVMCPAETVAAVPNYMDPAPCMERSIGAICAQSCAYGYRGSPVPLTCGADGAWSQVPAGEELSCEPVTCDVVPGAAGFPSQGVCMTTAGAKQGLSLGDACTVVCDVIGFLPVDRTKPHSYECVAEGTGAAATGVLRPIDGATVCAPYVLFGFELLFTAVQGAGVRTKLFKKRYFESDFGSDIHRAAEVCSEHCLTTAGCEAMAVEDTSPASTVFECRMYEGPLTTGLPILDYNVHLAFRRRL